MEDTDEFKWAVKVVIKRQMRYLLEQLRESGEEVAVMSVNMKDETCSHFGSPSGEWFISEQNNLVKNFLNFCKYNVTKINNPSRSLQQPAGSQKQTARSQQQTAKSQQHTDRSQRQTAGSQKRTARSQLQPAEFEELSAESEENNSESQESATGYQEQPGGFQEHTAVTKSIASLYKPSSSGGPKPTVLKIKLSRKMADGVSKEGLAGLMGKLVVNQWKEIKKSDSALMTLQMGGQKRGASPSVAETGSNKKAKQSTALEDTPRSTRSGKPLSAENMKSMKTVVKPKHKETSNNIEKIASRKVAEDKEQDDDTFSEPEDEATGDDDGVSEVVVQMDYVKNKQHEMPEAIVSRLETKPQHLQDSKSYQTLRGTASFTDKEPVTADNSEEDTADFYEGVSDQELGVEFEDEPESSVDPGTDSAEATTSGSKVDKTPGSKVDKTPGSKVDKTPGLNVDKTPGLNVDKTPGSKADKTPGFKADKIAGSKVDKTPGLNIDKTPGSKADKTPGSKENKTPGSKADKLEETSVIYSGVTVGGKTQSIKLDGEPFVCKICDKTLNSRSGYRIHMARMHYGEKASKVLKCDVCGWCFSKPHDLRKHKVGTHMRQCDNCQTYVSEVDPWTEPGTTVNSHRHVVCGQCQNIVVFTSLNKPKREIVVTDDLEELKKLKRVKIDEKGLVPEEENEAVRHTTNDLNELPVCRVKNELRPVDVCNFCCVMCNKLFASQSDVLRHQMTHYSGKQFMCDICGATVRSSLTLKMHKKLHTEITIYPCRLCRKRYRNKSGVIDHMGRVHNVYDMKHADVKCSDIYTVDSGAIHDVKISDNQLVVDGDVILDGGTVDPGMIHDVKISDNQVMVDSDVILDGIPSTSVI